MHAERLNFRSTGINPGESLLDYESRLNSFNKSCEFQNYDRDSAHLEMVLIAAPQKIKEKLLLTPDLTLDIAKNIFKTMEVGSKWVSQASSIKLENNNDVKIKQEVNLNLAKRDKQNGSKTSEAASFSCIKHRIFQTFYYSTNDIIIISSSGNYLPSYIGDGKKRTHGRKKDATNKYSRAERAIQQKQRRRGQTVQALRAKYVLIQLSIVILI